MNSDVFAGIRNAVIRGDSIEKAARSFINAGYSEAEVSEVVEALQRGTLSISPTQAAQATLTAQPIPAQPAQQIAPLPKNQTAKDIKSLFVNPFKKKPVQALPMSMPIQQQAQQSSQQVPLLSGALPQTKIKRFKFDPVLVILITVLVVLAGILILSLFFKGQIASLFS